MDKKLQTRVRTQIYFWLGAFLFLLCFLWMFSGILLPFIAGMVLAYFLDPVADALERLGLSRIWATVLILVMFVLLFALSFIILIPILVEQVTGLLARLPELIGSLQHLIANSENKWIKEFVGTESQTIHDNLHSILTQGVSWLTSVFQQLWASGKALVSVVSLMIVTPVVAFYLLYDWDHMVERVDGWLPRQHRETIRMIMSQINDAVGGFVRGQGTVCLILGSFYGVSLTVLGLNFGLLIGLFAGFISFIPYVGSTVGFVLSIGVALVQFWPDYWMIILTATIFFVGQFLEGNILSPKLVGERIGLHPVWLMFALFAFGSLFGFTGMLIAVPVSAAIGVVARFILGLYLNSEFYLGEAVSDKEKTGKS